MEELSASDVLILLERELELTKGKLFTDQVDNDFADKEYHQVELFNR